MRLKLGWLCEYRPWTVLLMQSSPLCGTSLFPTEVNFADLLKNNFRFYRPRVPDVSVIMEVDLEEAHAGDVFY